MCYCTPNKRTPFCPDCAPHMFEQLATLRARLEAAEKANRILEIKNAGTLANNLCPDHRDKQVGQPCLACTIEAAEKDTARIDYLQTLCEAYGFENEHHGNRWCVEGAFMFVRDLLDADMAELAKEGKS